MNEKEVYHAVRILEGKLVFTKEDMDKFSSVDYRICHFIDEYGKLLNQAQWIEVLNTYQFPTHYLIRYIDYIIKDGQVLAVMASTHDLGEGLIEYISGREDLNLTNKIKFWRSVSRYQNISEKFITRHKNLIFWDQICANENINISEKFLYKHRDLVHWRSVLNYKKLSMRFIRKYRKSLELPAGLLLTNQNLSEKEIRKILKEHKYLRSICKQYVIFALEHQNVSRKFIDKFRKLNPKSNLYYIINNKMMASKNINAFQYDLRYELYLYKNITYY